MKEFSKLEIIGWVIVILIGGYLVEYMKSYRIDRQINKALLEYKIV